MSTRMPIPLQELRLAVHEAHFRLWEIVHETHFADLTLIDAIPLVLCMIELANASMHDRPFNTMTIAKRLRIPRATAQRLLKKLEARGYLERDGYELSVNGKMRNDEAIRKMARVLIAWGEVAKKAMPA